MVVVVVSKAALVMTRRDPVSFGSAPSGHGEEPGISLVLSRLPVTFIDGAQRTAPISALEML